MCIGYNYCMSILYLHYDKFYIVWVVLTTYGLTECIINEWMIQEQSINVTKFLLPFRIWILSAFLYEGLTWLSKTVYSISILSLLWAWQLYSVGSLHLPGHPMISVLVRTNMEKMSCKSSITAATWVGCLLRGFSFNLTTIHVGYSVICWVGLWNSQTCCTILWMRVQMSWPWTSTGTVIWVTMPPFTFYKVLMQMLVVKCKEVIRGWWHLYNKDILDFYCSQMCLGL